MKNAVVKGKEWKSRDVKVIEKEEQEGREGKPSKRKQGK